MHAHRFLAISIAAISIAICQAPSSADQTGELSNLAELSAAADAAAMHCAELWIGKLGKSTDPLSSVVTAITSQCSASISTQADLFHQFSRALAGERDERSPEDSLEFVRQDLSRTISRELVKLRSGAATTVTMDLSKLVAVFSREPVRPLEMVERHSRRYDENYSHWRKRMNTCGEEWIEKLTKSIDTVESVADAIASQCASTIDAAKTAFMFVDRQATRRDRHAEEFLTAVQRELVKVRAGLPIGSLD
jgi:hypothetical protein